MIGSTNSSNSNRLVEVAREHGAASHLIDNHLQVDEAWLEGVETVGITSGASAPEELVERLVAFFRERGAEDVSELRTVDEDVRFMLPNEIRKRARRLRRLSCRQPNAGFAEPDRTLTGDRRRRTGSSRRAGRARARGGARGARCARARSAPAGPGA